MTTLRSSRPDTLFLAVFLLLLSGCIPNKFYRQNNLEKSKRVINAAQQDRFVPEALGKNFAEYVQARAIKEVAWDACPKNQPYATNYFLGFLELDEYGELWYHSHTGFGDQPDPMRENWTGKPGPGKGVDPKDEFKHAINLIRYAKAVSRENQGHGEIRLIVFIHGWKNNASDASGNVWGFRQLLHEMACHEGEQTAGTTMIAPVPVVGIYIGWRGAQTNVPVLREFTFASRRSAAAGIPGTDLLEALTILRREAKGLRLYSLNNSLAKSDLDLGDGSQVFLIGHSMGALLLEHAVSVATAEAIFEQRPPIQSQTRTDPGTCCATNSPIVEKPPFRPPFDGVIYLNSASQATDARQLLSLMQENEGWLNQEDATGKKPSFLFLALTSEGDAATKVAMPLGETLVTRNTRNYYEEEPDRPPGRLGKQSTWAKHSVATIGELRTHQFCDKDAPNARCSCDSKQPGTTDSLTWPVESANTTPRYCLTPVADAWNHTRYWAAEMPTSIVPDHGGIFSDSVVKMLIAISKLNSQHSLKPLSVPASASNSVKRMPEPTR